MEIIKSFGINPYLLVAQIINFLILFYLLKRFAYKPILKMLEDRRKTIAEGLENAKAGQKILDNALVKEKDILKAAEKNADSILSDAKKEALMMIEKAKADAKADAEKLIIDAKAQIQVEYRETEKRLAAKTYALAVEVLKKALTSTISEELQKNAIDKFLKENKIKN